MTEAEALALANEIVAPYDLIAEFLGDVRTVGVQGDYRTYTRAIVLIGPFPGWDVLALLSTEISNRTPISRVNFEIAKKE